jgi:ribosomal protein S18 acetylase RimI-like enzyme
MVPDGAVRARLLALPDDLDLAVQVWQLANVARGKVPDGARCARARAKLTEPEALAVVAADGDGIVGMALAEPGRDDDGLGPPLPDLCHISMVFVHPEHWGRRIGLQLLDALAEQAADRGQLVLQLWTGQDNHRAQHLYRRAGFQPTGRAKHLPTGQLAIQLARPTAAMPR